MTYAEFCGKYEKREKGLHCKDKRRTTAASKARNRFNRRNAMFRRAFYAPLYYTMLFLYNIMAEQPDSVSAEGYSPAAFNPPVLPVSPLIIRLYTCTYAFYRCGVACYVRLKLCFKRVFTVISQCYYSIKF